jgi:hypothetical protein
MVFVTAPIRPIGTPALGSVEARARNNRATTSAQIIMTDAFEAVTTGHASLKNWAKHTGTQALRGMRAGDKAAAGVGLGIAAAVGIAGMVVTGGLALPLLIGLGAGAYALKTMVKEIGNDITRKNRNWTARYQGAGDASTREQAALLSCEAADALRRAVDHYRMMKTDIIPNELVKYEQMPEYMTCEDAINHAKAVARFIHHGDKVRNYVLPCIDMCIFYLEQYKEMCDTWARWEPELQTGLESWFRMHPAGACNETPEDVCYAPKSPPGSVPFRPKNAAKTAWTLPTGSVSPPAGAIEMTDLIAAMKAGRDKIHRGMHLMSGGGETSYNYSAEARSINRVRSGSPAGAHMARARTQSLIDAVWRQVDRPGYFSRASRRVGHWYTRNNKTEKAAAMFSTVTDVGSIFLPFLKGVDTLSDVARSAVSAGAQSGAALANVGMGVLCTTGRVPFSNSLLKQEVLDTKAMEDPRGTAATIQSLMPKLMTHFANGAQAMTDINDLGATPIGSCKAAFGYCAHVGELLHQMSKVARYIMPCIAMTDFVAEAAYSWQLDEDVIWASMERDVSDFVTNGYHDHCRANGTKCYGPKHHQTGGGIFSRTAVVWHLLSESTPHNPL